MSEQELPPQPPHEQQPATPQTHHPRYLKEGVKSILSTILILVAAPVAALILIAFVFQSYQVDGPSMQNTLHNDDRLIVYKLPKTLARVTRHNYIPKRYDIIVFNKKDIINADFTHDQNKQLIKRVIGLPGDRVVVKDNSITIYNKQHPEGFNPDAGQAYQNSFSETTGDIDVTLKADQIFVSGDNRSNSLDSRFFGPIQTDDIVGKLVLRLWPDGKSF